MDEQSDNGPVMFAATPVLRGHKTRIGKIGGNINLPRTVPLVNLVAGGIGAVLGLLFAAVVHPSLQSYSYSAVVCAAAGVFLVTYSPLQGESLLKWIGVTVAAKRQEVKIDGQSVRIAVGIAYISEPARGPVRIAAGAVEVDPAQFDERGVLICARNRNLPTRTTSRQLAVDNSARTLPPNTALPKAGTTGSGTTLTGKTPRRPRDIAAPVAGVPAATPLAVPGAATPVAAPLAALATPVPAAAPLAAPLAAPAGSVPAAPPLAAPLAVPAAATPVAVGPAAVLPRAVGGGRFAAARAAQSAAAALPVAPDPDSPISYETPAPYTPPDSYIPAAPEPDLELITLTGPAWRGPRT